jgi:GMP synthase-like glutamine amidotransferase
MAMTHPARITVAIVDNAVEPAIYRPVEHWSRLLGVPWHAFLGREGHFPDPAEFSHVILTGSEASILEREGWVDAEAAFVREAVAAGTAILGSCWGHQLIALALAGEHHVRRADRPEIGWIPIRLERSSGLLGPAGTTAFVFSSHFDEVFDLPGSFEILASSEGCAVQAFQVGGGPVWGLQCHPEIDIETGRRFIRDLIGCGFKGRKALLEAQRQTPRDSGLVARIVRAFLEGRRPDQGTC